MYYDTLLKNTISLYNFKYFVIIFFFKVKYYKGALIKIFNDKLFTYVNFEFKNIWHNIFIWFLDQIRLEIKTKLKYYYEMIWSNLIVNTEKFRSWKKIVLLCQPAPVAHTVWIRNLYKKLLFTR